MVRSVSYIQIVASRLRELFDRKLEGSEWGRVGAIIKKYDRPAIEEVLDILETKKLSGQTDVTLGMFQFLIKQHSVGKDVKAALGYFINKTVSQKAEALSETQQKGQTILTELTLAK